MNHPSLAADGWLGTWHPFYLFWKLWHWGGGRPWPLPPAGHISRMELIQLLPWSVLASLICITVTLLVVCKEIIYQPGPFHCLQRDSDPLGVMVAEFLCISLANAAPWWNLLKCAVKFHCGERRLSLWVFWCVYVSVVCSVLFTYMYEHAELTGSVCQFRLLPWSTYHQFFTMLKWFLMPSYWGESLLNIS